MARKNAFYAQSGGVTAVINASACGVIETCRKHSDKIANVYAGRNGIIGALTEELIDTSQESDEAIAALKHTPSGGFGSCRFKLKSLEDNKREYERLIEIFKAHDIGYFFYNGGGDSADTCFKVSQLSEKMGFPVQAIHVPKTVDNDLPITDNCPGFGSVAKYIAVSSLEASFDVRSMAATSTKIFVIEGMGRQAGWIAAAGAMAATEDCDLPIVVLFPEVEFNQEQFLPNVDEKVKEFGYCSIVVSEGCHWPDGKFLAEQGTRDSFGHAQLGGAAPVVANMIKEALGHKFHWAVADYLQRAARHLASASDVEQAYALGKAQRVNKAQLAALGGPEQRRRTHISARTRRGIELIPVDDVRYFQADQKYVTVCTPDLTVLIEETLKALEQEFAGQFVRIHRNALVARRYLAGLEKDTDGHPRVRLEGIDASLEVSRRHSAAIRKLLKSLQA